MGQWHLDPLQITLPIDLDDVILWKKKKNKTKEPNPALPEKWAVKIFKMVGCFLFNSHTVYC